MDGSIIIKPEERLLFLPFEREQTAIREMRSIFDQVRNSGAKTRAAYLRAFRETHHRYGSLHEIEIGPKSFWHLVFESSRRAEYDIRRVQHNFIRPEMWPSVSVPNLISAHLGPIRLLEIATGEASDDMEESMRWGAMRKLSVAHQYALVDLAYPADRIGRDIFEIERALKPRINSGELVTLHVTARRNPKDDFRVTKQSIVLHTDKDKAVERASQIDHRGQIVHAVYDLRCRVCHANGITYLVYTEPRGKDSLSTVLKLTRKPRDEWLKDQCAWRDVVVAIIDGGKTRLASRQDAGSYLKLCLDRLWKYPLAGKQDEETGGSHPDYWGLKVLGRFHRALDDDPSVIFSGRVEHQITTLRDWLVAQTATDELNHFVRRGSQLIKHLLPHWFPQVKWEDPEIREDHFAHWRQGVRPSMHEI